MKWHRMRGLLDPKGDFVFKNIFGSPEHPKDSDEKDMLTAWTEFLRDPESEKVRSLEMSVEEIREAKDDIKHRSDFLIKSGLFHYDKLIIQ